MPGGKVLIVCSEVFDGCLMHTLPHSSVTQRQYFRRGRPPLVEYGVVLDCCFEGLKEEKSLRHLGDTITATVAKAGMAGQTSRMTMGQLSAAEDAASMNTRRRTAQRGGKQTLLIAEVHRSLRSLNSRIRLESERLDRTIAPLCLSYHFLNARLVPPSYGNALIQLLQFDLQSAY